MTFTELETHAVLDLTARQMVRKMQSAAKYAEAGKALEQEPRYLIDRFQLEPTDPHMVGMNEALSDQFSPEELVRLMARPPACIDWDEYQEMVLEGAA